MSEPRFPGISIVFPAWNEEENVPRAIRQATDVASRLCADYEILVVDDGSRDGTADRVREAAKGDSRVVLLQHPENRGYGAAVATGLRAARQPLVFYTDADLQFDLAEIEGLLERIDAAPVVIGYRVDRDDPWYRTLNGVAWSRLQGLVFGLRIRDVDCAFKLFRREVLGDLPTVSEGAFFSMELLLRMHWAGHEIEEVPVRHFARTAGVPSGARGDVIRKAFVEMWRFWWALRREAR